jgi:hypothetical protein
MKKFLLVITLALLVSNLMGCSASRKTTSNPVLGSWSYSVESPEGTYTGTIIITELGDQLAGEISSDQSLGNIIISAIEYEDGLLQFNLQGPESGELVAKVRIEENTFSGSVDNLTYGVNGMAIKGTRNNAGEVD